MMWILFCLVKYEISSILFLIDLALKWQIFIDDCEEVHRDIAIVTTLTAHWLSYRFLYSRARALPFQIHCPLCTETVWRRNHSSKAGRKFHWPRPKIWRTQQGCVTFWRSNGRYVLEICPSSFILQKSFPSLVIRKKVKFDEARRLVSFFDIFASPRRSLLRMRTKVVSFFIYFQDLSNKKMGLVRITSQYPNFNGSHFGLPPSEIHRMTGLPPKIVWTMVYSHRPHFKKLRPKITKIASRGSLLRWRFLSDVFLEVLSWPVCWIRHHWDVYRKALLQDKKKKVHYRKE